MYLGNDSPMDLEVALTAECEGNHRICNAHLPKLLVLFISNAKPLNTSKNSKYSECNCMKVYSILNCNINFLVT